MAAPDLLRRLRSEGFTLEVEGDTLFVSPADRLTDAHREAIREAKPALLTALSFEVAQQALNLAIVRPDTRSAGDVLDQLSTTEPATDRQLERLRQLAADPKWGPKRRKTQAWAQRVIERSVTEAGVYVLLGVLGDRLAKQNGNGSEPA